VRRFSGHDVDPMINTVGQLTRHLSTAEHPFGVQLDTGMNRLGLEIDEWASRRNRPCAKLSPRREPALRRPDHPMNRQQLDQFLMMDGINVPRSLAATGGMLRALNIILT
jgi:alanine racemase